MGPRDDSGYHELLSVFQAVDVWETLTAEDAAEFSLEVVGDVVTDEIPLDENNLALQAARAVQKASGYDGAAALHITKRVPVGGGMAGGSADAAAALVALDALWETGLSRERLLECAAELGSDVPFCLEGYTQIGRGRGHLLEPVSSQPFYWVIVPSHVHLSTPWSIRLWMSSEEMQHPRCHAHPHPDYSKPWLPGDAPALAGELLNDLAAPALSLAPGIQTVLDTGSSLGALAGMVSGSGPTCVFLVEDVAHQTRLLDGFAGEGVYALAATSPARGLIWCRTRVFLHQAHQDEVDRSEN